MSAHDAVENYLDDLFDHLAGTGGAGRRALTETEDHLRSATAELVASGLPEDMAARRAVTRFGDARRIARDLRVVHRNLAGLARQLFMGAWLLGGIGAVAVGLSGLVAAGMRAAWGATFVSGDTNGITYTAARCADYVGFFPGHSCQQAAALHHASEVVFDRAGFGVLGVLALIAWAIARRTFLNGSRWSVEFGSVALVGVTLFGLAAVGLGGQSLLRLIINGSTGVGAYLSAGLVAGVFALGLTATGLRVRDTA